MGCFKVKTTRTGGSLNVEVERIGGELYTCISRIGGGLHTEVSPVCTASLEGKFLEVEPGHVWLLEANQFEADVDVHSNAEWRAG